MKRNSAAFVSFRLRLLSAGYLAAVLVIAFGCFVRHAEAQAFRLEPSILVGEEYNDNVFLQRSERADAFITHIAPSVHVRYSTLFWAWDVNYAFNYYYYQFLNRHDNTGRELPDHDQTHALSASNRTELLKENLFLEVRDEYSRVSQNIVIDYTQQSPSTNQVDQNVFTINPYAVARPFASVRLLGGYIFQETRYLNASAATQSANVNREDTIGYGEIGYDLASRLTVSVGVRNTEERNNQQSFNQLDVYAGPQYTYGENRTIFVKAGKSWFHFRTDPTTNQRLSPREYWLWDTGVSHRMSTLTLTLGARRFVAQDPQRAITLQDQYTATITKNGPRYVLTLGGGKYDYRDAVINQRISTSDQAQGSFVYRLTPTTNATLGAGYQDVYDLILHGATKIALGNIRLEHRLTEKDSVALEYLGVNSHSYDIALNNYSNNRCLIEYRRVF